VLPKQHRLTRAAEFRAAMRAGRRRAGTILVTHIAPSSPSAPARFGFIVSKAVGNAVVRNRVKRRLRALAAEHLAGALGGADSADIVVRALPPAADASYPVLRAELLEQLGPRAVPA